MYNHSRQNQSLGDSYGNNDAARTRTEAEAILWLATEEAEKWMLAGSPFTALDISNTLKSRNLPVRHSEVAAVIRGLHAGGGMVSFGYEREPIMVLLSTGERTQAYLYRLLTQSASDYTEFNQIAAPVVAPDRARALDDVCPAGMPPSSLACAALAGMVGGTVTQNGNARTRTARQRRLSGHQRRDGAIAVPRALIARAGWAVGDTLKLVYDAATRSVLLRRASGLPDIAGAIVRVWANLRVRIAKSKLLLAGPTRIDPADLRRESMSVDMHGLRIASRHAP